MTVIGTYERKEVRLNETVKFFELLQVT